MESLMAEHTHGFDTEEGFCTHFDEITVTGSPIASNSIMLQYPSSPCPVHSDKDYSPYFFDFIDGTHMKLLVETGHNWILRYGDQVDEYDVPECSLDNLHIRHYDYICGKPENKGIKQCQEYLAEKKASKAKDAKELQTETQIQINQ